MVWVVVALLLAREAVARTGDFASVVAAAAVAGGALLLVRDEPAAATEPPAPVAAARAEHRLERQIATSGYDDGAAVRLGARSGCAPTPTATSATATATLS